MNRTNQELLLYCILHEKTFKAEPSLFCPMGHIDFFRGYSNGDYEVDIDFCCFPLGYAFCEPPVFPDVEREPFQEELEEAEVGAQEFMLQLEEV